MTVSKTRTRQDPALVAGSGLDNLNGNCAKDEVEQHEPRDYSPAIPWSCDDPEFHDLLAQIAKARLDEQTNRRNAELGLRRLVRYLTGDFTADGYWLDIIEQEFGEDALDVAQVQHGLGSVNAFVEVYNGLGSRDRKELLERVREETDDLWTIEPKG